MRHLRGHRPGSGRDQLHVAPERDDERFDILGIGRDDVVSILYLQGSIETVPEEPARQ
jgi:hypothetical protein